MHVCKYYGWSLAELLDLTQFHYNIAVENMNEYYEAASKAAQ